MPQSNHNSSWGESYAESSTVDRRDGLFVYRVPDTDLAHGTSLGNAHAWATSKGTGALEGLFSADVGKQVTGSLVINFCAAYKDLLLYSRKMEQEQDIGAETMVRLAQKGRGEFVLHPAYQEHLYDLVGDIRVSEIFFLPNTGSDDPAAALLLVELENRSEGDQIVAAVACLQLPGEGEREVVCRYDGGVGVLLASNQSDRNYTRAFGAYPPPDAYLATRDVEKAWDPAYPLPNAIEHDSQAAASIQNTIFIRAGERKTVCYVVCFSAAGEKDALSIFRSLAHYRTTLGKTISHYKNILGKAEVTTPDSLINQGVQWSKANMLRVLASYPTGKAFTNDPGKSSHVVVRDAAWFVYGSDFMLPESACDMLRTVAGSQKPSGLIIEYYNAITGDTEDYGLNINDNTPLFILAAAHHIEVSGHTECANHLYPAMVRAADYLISQEDERGLVFCSARGTGAHGIAGWRNIIPGRAINGAVTEINAECYAALHAVGRICDLQGDDERSNYFHVKADYLRAAVNKHLKNPDNGMYYLNIDVDGSAITELTADEIFPMIFGVADEDTGRLITLRLANKDFMTPAGLRTVSSLNPLYTPDTLVGLQGGVWPGVTWWYAMASVASDPSLMVESLKKSYRQYAARPGVFNTVPGQFSEWFEGESLTNKGMRLSPWEPPRFLWAMIEGGVGLSISDGEVKIRPKIPHDWKWLRVRDVQTGPGQLGFFAHRRNGRLVFHTASKFMRADEVELYDEDVTDLLSPVSEDICLAAYVRRGETLICVGDTSGEKQPAPFVAASMLDNVRKYHVELYQSELAQWMDVGSHSGGALSRLSVQIEPGGFVLLRLRD